MAMQSITKKRVKVKNITGEFLPTTLDVSKFCGWFTGYLKGSINDWSCNGLFTNYYLYNANIKGIFMGTMNASGKITTSVKTELPEDYLYGNYDFYLGNDNEED